MWRADIKKSLLVRLLYCLQLIQVFSRYGAMNLYIKNFKRIVIIIAVICLIICTFIISYECILYFYGTSYRFVSIFLLLIFSSNVLAKLCIAYIETMKPSDHDYV